MEKIQKNAALIGKVLKVLRGIIFGVGCAVLVFTVLAMIVPLPLSSIMDTADFTLELGSVELSVAPDSVPPVNRFIVVLTLLHALTEMVFLWVVLGMLMKIFGGMAEGRPFAGADTLRKLAWVYLGFSIGETVLGYAAEVLSYTAYRLPDLLISEKILGCTLETVIDVNFLFVFAVLLLLSYVFRYGEELQRQDDETL